MDVAQRLFEIAQGETRHAQKYTVDDQPYAYSIMRYGCKPWWGYHPHPNETKEFAVYSQWTVLVEVTFRSGPFNYTKTYGRTATWSEEHDSGPLTEEWIRGSIVALRQVLDEALDGEGRV